MAIFSRRTIQRLINENASFLEKNQSKKHLETLNLTAKHNKISYLQLIEEGKELNTIMRNYINTEWEVALITGTLILIKKTQFLMNF